MLFRLPGRSTSSVASPSAGALAGCLGVTLPYAGTHTLGLTLLGTGGDYYRGALTAARAVRKQLEME